MRVILSLCVVITGPHSREAIGMNYDWLFEIDYWNIDYWNYLQTITRLAVAVLAGAIIGIEREHSDKPAGLRTHMLVCLGAATFMLGALELSKTATDEKTIVDPARALAGVIGGVGFLGAGAIIQSQGSIQGITTAASIWIAAAIGVCSGMGLFSLAITSGVLAVAVLWFLGRFERSVMQSKN